MANCLVSISSLKFSATLIRHPQEPLDELETSILRIYQRLYAARRVLRFPFLELQDLHIRSALSKAVLPPLE